MKKLLLILTTLASCTGFATETENQADIVNPISHSIPKSLKSISGLVLSAFGASLSTAGTACLALNTKYFILKALYFSQGWSYKKEYAAEAPIAFGHTMFIGLSTLTFGAMTLLCLKSFGENYKDLFYRIFSEPLETEEKIQSNY